VIPCSCKSTDSQDQTGQDDVRFIDESAGAEHPDGVAVVMPPSPPSPAGAAAAAAGVPAGTVEAAAPKAAQAQQPGSLQEDVTRAKLREQQGSFLASEYLKKGDAMLERADLAGALEAYSSALNLDPTSQAAREKMHKVEGLMGTSYADAANLLKDATEQEMVRRAQARLAAEDASIKGDNALRAGEIDVAIEKYRQAEMILRYHPLIATHSLDEKIVAGKLERAIQMSDEAARLAEQQAQAQAQLAKEKREREEREYRENKLRALYSEANTAFLNENFKRAEELTDQILADDPGNPAATTLRGVARDMRHAKVEEQNRQDYREQWIRTFEELDTMNVPQTDTLVFDDLKRWREVSQRKPLEFSILDPATAEDKKIVLDRLDSVRFAPRFGTADGAGSPLTEIAAFLQSLTGVNFMISPKVMSELDEEQRSIKLDLPERSVRKVLDIIAETHENLRWKVEDAVVKFVTKDEMKGGQVLRTYEVRDLIHPIHDFPGSEMNVSPSGGYNPPEEDKVERESNIVSAEQLETLIRNNVAAGSWEADPQNAIKITPHGTMVVHQVPAVQMQIAKLLEDLREATGIMVDIQARFLKVEDNFLEDIGVDFRGLGQPGLGTNASFNDFGDPSTQLDLGKDIGTSTDLGAFYDNGSSTDVRGRVENLYDVGLGDQNVLTASGGLSAQWTYLTHMQLEMVLRAVSKSERVELVTAPRITLYNTARGNLSVVTEVAYVQDFNVEIAQGASIADPIVNVVRDGIVLDVRPVVSADRRFITLELRPTVAQLKRPIKEISTTLGSQNSVTIQLPEVEIQRVRTSIPMPDGGTVMLGGTKVSDKQDNRSGVPILNKIPIVSFFFERKGNYISNRKLLILLKANIVIPSELEPTPAQTLPPGKKSDT
jgi:type II secretory pathway component GspD/PulD (secretin)/tetratricopeptide (TPR) repeat protein